MAGAESENEKGGRVGGGRSRGGGVGCVDVEGAELEGQKWRRRSRTGEVEARGKSRRGRMKGGSRLGGG